MVGLLSTKMKKDKEKQFSFVTFILPLISSVASLELIQFSVPPFASEGENVPFHCAYSVDSSKLAELDIKWYLGSSPSPFMVFLPNLQSEPQVIDPRFRQMIVFSEEVEGSWFMMENISTDMSGVYTCKVSTNMEERVSRKRITVYSKFRFVGKLFMLC